MTANMHDTMSRVSHAPVSAFGALLRRYRRRVGLTQEELAERAAMSARGIRALERGERQFPYRVTVRQLADALELDLEERAQFEAASMTAEGNDTGAPDVGVVHLAHTQTQHAPGHNLPNPETPFIGRIHDVAAVVHLLRRDGVRLVTLAGPAGIGKTRLALRVATCALPDFEGGAFFVPLDTVRDPARVVNAMATALQVDCSRGVVKQAVAQHIGDERMLLVLDNFEHVRAAAPLVSSLLRACPRLAVLATSRAALCLMSERQFWVPPLSLPTDDGPRDPKALMSYDAVAFFVDRARARTPDFALTPATGPLVLDIARRLDGLPLAIELAATRITMFPVPALAQQLSSSMDILAQNARDAPDRHRTLGAAIEWSYRLLSAADRLLFSRLSVLAPGWTVEAAAAVCNRAGDADTLAGVESLLQQSLVQRFDGPAPPMVEPIARFRMLETIREFAAGRLQRTGVPEDIHERHALYYVQLAESIKSMRSQLGQVAFQARLAAEQPNLQAAWRWGVKHRRTEIILRLAAVLWEVWLARGLESGAYPSLREALESDADVDPIVRLRALDAAGNLATAMDDAGGAYILHRQSLSLARTDGNKNLIAMCLGNLSLAAKALGDHEQAAALLCEAEALFRSMGNSQGVAGVLSACGDLARERGEYGEAARLLEESLALWTELGSEYGAARAEYGLGLVDIDRGRAMDAEQRVRRAITLLKESGDRYAISDCVAALGQAAQLRGDIERSSVLRQLATTVRDNIMRPAPIAPSAGPSATTDATSGPERPHGPPSGGRPITLEQIVALALDDGGLTG